MAFNGSGTFNRIYNWVTDKANGFKITASRMDGEFDGIATGLSQCITKDGQTTITANIPFNNNKITGLGNGTARTDVINVGQVQDNQFQYLGTTGGTADAYTLTPSPSITAYATTQQITAKINATNLTTTPYLQVSAIANPATTAVIKKLNASKTEIAVETSDLLINGIYHFQRNSANDAWIVLNPEKGYFNLINATKATTTNQGVQYLKSNKNAIINGDFNVWQRGGTFTSVADGTYTADRWFYSKISSAVHDITLSSDVPTVAQAGRLFKYSLKADCQTVDSSIASGDLVRISQRIEGYNWLPLAQKTITLSFWVKATKTGIYCVALGNSGADRSYVAEYNVNASNTWEFKTITFTASPAAGTWDYTNGIGLALTFTLASGSTFQTTKDTWQTGSFFATANQVNACDSTSNDFFITAVQLEEGDVATPFENRTLADELRLCQRYYEAATVWAVSYNSSGSQIQRCMYFFKTTKRANPSATLSVLSGLLHTLAVAGIDPNGLWISFGSASGGIDGQFGVIINSEL